MRGNLVSFERHPCPVCGAFVGVDSWVWLLSQHVHGGMGVVPCKHISKTSKQAKGFCTCRPGCLHEEQAYSGGGGGNGKKNCSTYRNGGCRPDIFE